MNMDRSSRALQFLSHWRYDVFIGVVLAMNLATMGVEAVMSTEDSVPAVVIVLEGIFISVYFADLVAQLCFRGRKIWRRKRFWLDAFTVVTGLLEFTLTSLLDVLADSSGDEVLDTVVLLRIFRLLRVVRVFRLVSHCGPLLLLAQGMMTSMDTLFWTFLAMAMLVYLFGLLGIQIITEDLSDDETYQRLYRLHFSDLGVTCLTLMQAITLDSMAPIYKPMIIAVPGLCVYFASFMLLGSIALVNLVTAVLVETARRTAMQDVSMRKMGRKARAAQLVPELVDIFHTLDANGNGTLGLNEILSSPPWIQDRIQAIANRIDIAEIFHMLDYDDSGGLKITEFVDGILRAGEESTPLEIIRIMNMCMELRKMLRNKQRGQDGKGFDRRTNSFETQE